MMDISKEKLIFSLVFIISLIFASCKTNPPSSPEPIVPTGNVKLNLQLAPAPDFSQTEKVVLLEDFANVSCIPCVTSNRIIESLANYSYGRDKLAVVKFPTNFPSPNDPFYLSNKEACDSRISYYSIFAAPTTIIDGQATFFSLSDSAAVKAEIDSRLALTSRFNITVGGSLEGDYVINVSISLIDTTGINLDDIVIHSIITETDIEFEQAPGSNGEKKFFDVMRLMLPSINGEPLRNLINSNEILYEFKDALLSSWNLENINCIVYLQNVNTREVFQAGSTF